MAPENPDLNWGNRASCSVAPEVSRQDYILPLAMAICVPAADAADATSSIEAIGRIVDPPRSRALQIRLPDEMIEVAIEEGAKLGPITGKGRDASQATVLRPLARKPTSRVRLAMSQAVAWRGAKELAESFHYKVPYD